MKDGDKVLVEGSDYTVSCNKNDFTNVTGSINVTISGVGNYSGSVTKSYQITKRDVALESESASKTYDGVALQTAMLRMAQRAPSPCLAR